MSFATVQTCTLVGISALPIAVEIHISGGLPGMSIVGLPQSAVRESKDRVKAAIVHSGFTFPMVKIIVNLAPADLPKHGGRFDLPIALGILLATEQLPENVLDNTVVLGELGLTGTIRAITGALPTALAYAGKQQALLIPTANVREAARSHRTHMIIADALQPLVQALRKVGTSTALREQLNKHYQNDGGAPLDLPMCLVALSTVQKPLPDTSAPDTTAEQKISLQISPQAESQAADPLGLAEVERDMSDVRGQSQARRALEVAAAGAHNMLMLGPPGTGKSMLASRLPSIQPPMSEQEAMESASIASISHTGFNAEHWAIRPFRAPHHTASGVGLVGGGATPMPGEISLAHHGVLFLDELTEFPRAVLDVLREPMETGRITLSRAAKQAEFPARFQLIAAMNPCPCGYYGDADFNCRCTPDQIQRYNSRVSAPFLDRIDLHLTVSRLSRAELQSTEVPESSEQIRERVVAARAVQMKRQGVANALLGGRALEQHCALSDADNELLNKAAEQLFLSLRATHRILKVARTIADLKGDERVERTHLLEALSYRPRTA